MDFFVPAEDAAPFVPFGGDDVAVFVEGDAVGGGGDAFAPGFWFYAVGVDFLGVVVGAEEFDDFTFFIEDADAAGELGDGYEVAVEIDGAGVRYVFGEDADDGAVEVEVDEAVVGAVADEDACWLVAVVEGEFMGGFEVPRFGFAGGGGFEFSVFVEDEDAVGGVAIDEPDVAVGCAVGVGEGELFADGFGDFGHGDVEEDFAFEGEFDEGGFGIFQAGGVDDVFAVFLDHGEAVVVIACVGQVAEVFAIRGVDLDAAFFAADDGDVEVACGVNVDFSV